jgi:hypothetical protein
MPRAWVSWGFLGLLILGLGGAAFAQDLEERVRQLEAALALERARGEAQAERLRELELTLVGMRAEQDRLVAEAVSGRELEEAIASLSARVRSSEPAARTSERFRVRGQGRLVWRIFGGEDISTDQSFEIEHLLLVAEVDLDDDLRLVLTPGISHSGSVAILEAALEYDVLESLTLVGGRFLVPFNGIHAWAYPSDSFIEPYQVENAPRPFLYAPYWDEGLMARGRTTFGAREQHALAFAAYVINGYSAEGLAGFHKRTIGDNNENKTLGLRISTTLRLGDDSALSIGAATQVGKSDPKDERDFHAVELDLELVWGPARIYAEIFHLAAEFDAGVVENPSARVHEVSRLYGLKLRPEVRLSDLVSVFVQADHLLARQPPRTGGLLSLFDLGDEETAITTVIAGVKLDLTASVKLRLEGGAFFRDSDLGPDIPFFAVSLYYAF